MKVILNGKTTGLQQELTLNSVVSSYSKERTHIVAEVNGHIIQEIQWKKTFLKDGDSIELLNFVGGGNYAIY